MFYGQLQDFLKCVDGILTAYGVAFVVTDMVVGCQKNADCIIWC